MPFPLAHPVAVLPLRRFCPRHLNFCALLLGSLVPDFGYALDDLASFPRFLGLVFGASVQNFDAVRQDWEWSDFSHSLAGSLGFCLPVGLLVLLVFLGLRASFVTLLPNPFRELLLPLCAKRPFLFFQCVFSLLIGIFLHLGWDTFTHDNGWLVKNWAFLRSPPGVFHLTGSVTQYIWFISSSGGISVLLFCFYRYVKTRNVPLIGSAWNEWKLYLLWLGLLLIPIAVAWPITQYFVRVESHAGNYQAIFHIFAQYYLMTFCCTVLLVTCGAKLTGSNRTPPAKGQSIG